MGGQGLDCASRVFECGISEVAAMMIVSGVVLMHGKQKVKQ